MSAACLLPALCFGMTGVLQKVYGRAGGGAGWYLPLVGLGVAATGLAALPLLGDRAMTARAGVVALGIGLSWGLGMIAVMIRLSRFGRRSPKLAPLYNLNTLVVVVLALVLFAGPGSRHAEAAGRGGADHGQGGARGAPEPQGQPRPGPP
ncbi:MAG: hypothetical protein IPH86_09175 [bacterium]|nr:hypothetical protein [bacterium]